MTIQVRLTDETFYFQRVGGVSRYAMELAIAMDRENLAIPTVTGVLTINDFLRKNAKSVNYGGFFVAKPFRYFHRIAGIGSRILEVLDRRCFDVVHTPFYNHEACGRASIPSIATFHDMIHERCGLVPSFQQRKRKTFDKVDHCIAVSEFTKRDMIRLYDADPEQITVVPLASAMMPPPESVPTWIKEPYFLWVGKRDGYKNFISLAKAFPRSRACQEGIKLVLAGDSPVSSSERTAWRATGLELDSVIYVSPTDEELSVLYRDALALVYPSELEGFGLPPLEAMGCGCPVAVSTSASLPEVVGEVGIQFDPNDVEAISGAIDRFAFDSDLRLRQAEAGLRRSKAFSWRKTAELTAATYQRLLDNRR